MLPKIKSKDGRFFLHIDRDMVRLSFADETEANYARDVATALLDSRHGWPETGPELKRRMTIERRVYDALIKANMLDYSV